jgi:sugar phosphate isomerase/epimerase
MQRSDFIKLITGITAGAALGCKLMPRENLFGIQLYTVRDDLAVDAEGTIRKLASYGYKQIESFERDKGIWWGKSNKEFKKLMDELEMKIISSHCDINKDFDKKAAGAAAIDMKYLLSSSFGELASADKARELAAQFNLCGETCKKNGIRFGYHNEDWDFKVFDGKSVLDIFIENTDPALVDFQMDFYWVVVGGQDPVELMNKYPGRFKLCHIKDKLKKAEGRDASCDLGQGELDLRNIIHEAKKNGFQYFFAEQERYDHSTPLESSKRNAAYLKTVLAQS